MGYYSDLWRKQKQSGTYQTKDGGTVKTSVAQQKDAAVKSAQQQASSGTYKTTSGGTVKSNNSNKTGSNAYKTLIANQTAPNLTYSAPTVSFTPVPKAAKTTTNVKKAVEAVDGSKIAAEAYRQKLAAKQQAYKNEQDKWVDDAVSSYYGKKAYNQYQTRDGGLVQGKSKENPYMGYTGQTEGATGAAGGRYQLAPELNRYNENTVLELLQKYNVTPEQVGMPLEYLYYGGNSYMGAPHLLRYSNDHVIQDHNGNRITVGDLRYALENGLYMTGNEAAYNNWVGGVAQNEVNTVDPYEYEEGYGSDYEDDYGYDDYAQAIIDAQNAQYQALIDALNNQSGVLNQQYDNNAANLYAQYRRSGLAMPELMAGTATGIADSFALQNNLAFQNNLNANELERASAQNDLNAQVNQYQADAQLQAAQTAAEWAQMAYQQRQAEQEAEREYQLALAKANADSTTSKPSISASQAMSAWENGYDTEAIREALLYYYGYIPATVVEDKATTQTVTPSYVGGTSVLPTTPLANKVEEGQYLNNLLRLYK